MVVGHRVAVAPGAAPGAVRLLAALAIVLGLFGMHVLAQHGATPVPAASSSLAAAASPDVVAHHGSHGTGDGAGDGAGEGAATSAVDGASGHGAAGMVMMCVAVLAAAITLLALLVRVRSRQRSWFLPRLSLPGSVPARWHLVAGAGPPPCWRFSVIRC